MEMVPEHIAKSETISNFMMRKTMKTSSEETPFRQKLKLKIFKVQLKNHHLTINNLKKYLQTPKRKIFLCKNTAKKMIRTLN